MRLVVDTNIIISALLKDSLTRKILTRGNLELLTLDFSIEEIGKYKNHLIRKAGITEEIFEHVLDSIKDKMEIVIDDVVLLKMEEASNIMDKIDPDDTPFIAAALATKSNIWSDDKHFKKQNKVKVWQTEKLGRYLEFV
tara:strand:- start:192 stop:608 length:417 start_codon:yes stop_codon:yes gene_type:complete